MIKITYRSQSDGNPIKVILADVVVFEDRHFRAYRRKQPIFIGLIENIIAEEKVDKDSYLVDRAEGQGD